MNISVVGVNKANLMDVITDNSVYVIKKDYFRPGWRMEPIAKADVNDLLSEDVLIVKICEYDS
jgi:hypothetical protein